MTITADARSGAPTASGPPTSSRPPAHTDDGRPDTPVPSVQAPRRRLAPAPVGARVVAGAIDIAVGSILVGGLTLLVWRATARPLPISGLTSLVVVAGLRWFAIATTGWSLGGLLLRVRMLGARNQKPSALGSFLHADLILAVSVTTLGLGAIALMRTAAADPAGRGWHDKLSGMALLHSRRAGLSERRAAPAAGAVAAPTVPERRPEGSPAGPPASPVPVDTPTSSQEPDRHSAAVSPQPPDAADSAHGPVEATAIVGVQSATEAQADTAPGGTAHPTTSDPVSPSIRRPRPARPGQPARHAGRAVAAGTDTGAPAQGVSATAAAYASALSGTGVSADGYSAIMAPRTASARTTARAAMAATVSSSPSASAASAGSAVSDAAAVAAASAAPMDPQASATLAAAESAERSAARSAQSATDGSADQAGSATPRTGRRTAAPAAQTPQAQEPTGKPNRTAPSPAPSSTPPAPRRPASGRSQMDAETATLDVIDDTSEAPKSTRGSQTASPGAPQPAQLQAGQAPAPRTPSAESSKKTADSEASKVSSSQDTTPSTQVPRSKATKPVTSQAMEPRHAHAQRWRTQSGHTGKSASGSSPAPTEDQREPASQPGVPRRESLFTSERQRLATGASSAPEVAHTFDTSSILTSGERNTQALIDSVPWSSVPTSVDAATVDSLPEGAIISDDGSPARITSASSQPSPLDLTNPATVPGGVPASTTGNAHPTVRSHRSHAQTSSASAASASTATPAASEAPSRRARASHRFQGPGIPEPAEDRASRSSSHSDSQAGSRTGSGGSHASTGSSSHGARSSRRESIEPAAQAPTQFRTNPAASTSGTATRAGHSAATGAAASAVPSAQTATPSLPSASSAAPALSVRLVPLLGGNPILIHEPTVVGRDPDNISAYPGAERVALDDPTRSVSKTHAAIFPLLDGVWVTDLHSTNGTRVEHRDGRSIEAVPDKALSALEGSTIFFGRIAFKVEVV